MITIINGPTKITGILRTFSCGSNKIFLNIVPDMELEVRNVPERIPTMMNSMGLNVVKDAIIDINRGTVYIDKTTHKSNSTTIAQKVQQPAQQAQSQPQVQQSGVKQPSSRLISSHPINNVRTNKPNDNQPVDDSYNTGRKDMRSYLG